MTLNIIQIIYNSAYLENLETYLRTKQMKKDQEL